MGRPEEEVQEIKRYDLYEDMSLDPASVRKLFTTNHVVRVIAHLFALKGDTPTRIKSTSSGELEMSDATAQADLAVIAAATHLEDAAHVTADRGVQTLGVRKDTRAGLGADGDYVPSQLTAAGDLRVRDDDLHTALGGAVDIDTNLDSAVVDCASGATTEVITTPGASKQLWILSLFGTANTAAGTIVLKSAATPKSGTIAVSDEGGFVLPFGGSLAMAWIKCATNEAFNITTVSCTFDGIVNYIVVNV